MQPLALQLFDRIVVVQAADVDQSCGTIADRRLGGILSHFTRPFFSHDLHLKITKVGSKSRLCIGVDPVANPVLLVLLKVLKSVDGNLRSRRIQQLHSRRQKLFQVQNHIGLPPVCRILWQSRIDRQLCSPRLRVELSIRKEDRKAMLRLFRRHSKKERQRTIHDILALHIGGQLSDNRFLLFNVHAVNALTVTAPAFLLLHHKSKLLAILADAY